MGVLIKSPVCYIDRGSIRRKKCSDQKWIPDEGASHLRVEEDNLFRRQ